MSTTDLFTIDRLRKENLEQYFTLVRMHLSFVVDICTDDVDGSADKPKQFRWNFHKKAKSTSNSSQNNVNSKNATEVTSITEEGMSRVYEIIEFLSKDENVKQEGIFRRTGSLSRQQELRQLLLTGSSLNLDEGRFSVHDCASVLKGFLAELPQPLLMDQYYQTYCTLAAQYPPSTESPEPKLLTALQLLLLLLTPLHRNFLQRLLVLLRTVADNESSNRMSPDTLATMFTPHLLCPRKLSPENFHADSVALAPLISFMIRQSDAVFGAPPQLLTDVSAYFTVRDRKRMLSPDIDLDESITDRTAANTVYTFVDRRRTHAENSTNPTDAALAQLYAHIHAMPDSQHKRQLIKQFNRQNGYGTPIQVQRTGKAVGSRSFGDSIKRHIFNKGLLNKTPKKGSGSNINTIEEKLNKEKLRLTDESKDVLHKNVVLKNLANKMSSIDCIDGAEEYESDASNESTLSEGALNTSKKHSPKFISEPNLSALDSRREEETPKNPKKRGKRLFRSKILSPSQNLNKRYQKRGAIRGTPTSCVTCFDDAGTGSETDLSCTEMESEITPTKPKILVEDTDLKVNYLTSTPGVPDMVYEEVSTPYCMNFRRASMSPITKSTQKLSKAMQESIMTPRSRKPLIITSEQRETSMSIPQAEDNPATEISTNSIQISTNSIQISTNSIYQSLSPKNDSDFVSSDDDNMASRSSHYSDLNASSTSGLRPENTRFVLTHDRPVIKDLNATLCGEEAIMPKFKMAGEATDIAQTSLSDPFREYLLSRSVLTATPVDLSILNKSTDDKITDSLLYCLDGNVPSDLTNSISNLVVEKMDSSSSIRSPLKNIDNFMPKEPSNSPNRKRASSKEMMQSDNKKAFIEKDVSVANENVYKLRETEL